MRFPAPIDQSQTASGSGAAGSGLAKSDKARAGTAAAATEMTLAGSMASYWGWPLVRQGPGYHPLSTASTPSPPPLSASTTPSAAVCATATAAAGACTPAAVASHARRRCAGLFTVKTATLLIALAGVLVHLQTFVYLGVMREAMPQVPSLFWSDQVMGLDASLSHNRPSALVVLDSEAVDGSKKAFEQDAANQDALIALHGDGAFHDKDGAGYATASWFNLLPKRPEKLQKETAQASSEQRSWQAAQFATKLARGYSVIGLLVCVVGAFGVLRSRPLPLRTFLLFSFFDTVIFALTIVSLGIIISYADVRALLCESISSGELHALLAYVRGHREGVSTPAPPDSPTYVAAARAASAALARRDWMKRASAMAHLPTDLAIDQAMSRRDSRSLLAASLPTFSLLGRAANGIWKRAVDVGAASSDAPTSSLWGFDGFLDHLLETESCDDVFAAFLVPFGLFICLVTLVVRIRCLFVIRSHYTAVSRAELTSSAAPTNPREFVGASSSTDRASARRSIMSEKGQYLSPPKFSSTRTTQHPDRMRQMQEKMA